mgnify:CR=1 FL=1
MSQEASASPFKAVARLWSVLFADRRSIREMRRVAHALGLALGFGVVAILWKFDSPGSASLLHALAASLLLAGTIYLGTYAIVMSTVRVAHWLGDWRRARQA